MHHSTTPQTQGQTEGTFCRAHRHEELRLCEKDRGLGTTTAGVHTHAGLSACLQTYKLSTSEKRNPPLQDSVLNHSSDSSLPEFQAGCFRRNGEQRCHFCNNDTLLEIVGKGGCDHKRAM